MTNRVVEQVHSYLNPLINYFYPTKKLIAKDKLPSGKIKKVYEKQLKTPYERLFEHAAVSDIMKTSARRIMESLDIVYLQENLEKTCEKPDRIVNGNYAALFREGIMVRIPRETSRAFLRATWVYRSVVRIDECPKSSCI